MDASGVRVYASPLLTAESLSDSMDVRGRGAAGSGDSVGVSIGVPSVEMVTI